MLDCSFPFFCPGAQEDTTTKTTTTTTSRAMSTTRHFEPDSHHGKIENPMTVQYLKEHLSKTTPRMILNKEVEKNLLKKMETDKVLQNMREALKKNVKKINEEPIIERKMCGKRLMQTSREVLYRVNVLCMHYRITKEESALDRVNKEILAVCAFTCWNPSHYLDIGEMCMAISLAIDWVGNDLPEETVALAKQSLIEKGIMPSFKNKQFWMKSHNNWNQICHGGLIAASVAIAEVDPELAAKTIHRALECLPLALKQYGPDGVYPEGSTYWEYGTSYSALTSSILETAFGTDFGILNSPGFKESADFRSMSKAPSGLFYNFSDCGDKQSNDGDMVLAFFASKSGNPLYYEEEKFLRDYRKMAKLCTYAGAGIVWLSQYEPCERCELPNAWKGDGPNPVVFFTSNDKHNYYFGAKGGQASNSHGNMDGGSFVFELNGVRWVMDPGNQRYNTLEEAGFDLWNMKQNSERWQLLSKNNHGHSTLTVDGEHHRVDGMSKITKFHDGDHPAATIDMTEAFGGKLKKAHRTFQKDSDNSLLVEDDLELSNSAEMITWQLMTKAEVNVKDFGAMLKLRGKKLKLELLSEPKVAVKVVNLDPPPHKLDRKHDGLKRIELNFPATLFKKREGKIQVRLSGCC